LMDADDLCAYEPQGRLLVQPMARLGSATPQWSPDAQQRLSRVPAFLRPMVQRRAEAYVNGLGEDRITCQHLSDLVAARFGSAGPPKFSVVSGASKPEPEEA